MITLSTIKAEAIKRLDKVVDPIYSNAECSFAENLHVELRELLSSEIDRAVDCIIGEVEEMKNYAPPYPVREGVTDGRNEAMQDGARRGYFDALNDLLQKLSTLSKERK